MKKEQVLELMNAIPPDLIEEADIQAPAKRRLPKLARTGLIAACLCLALVGTATAARYFGIRFVPWDNGYTYLQGGIIYHPRDSLSDEIRAYDGQPDTIKPFNSWQEAEDFIGVDLMNNPVLDASPASNYSLAIDRGKAVARGRFLVEVGTNLYCIRTYGCYQMEKVNIIVESHYFTDRMTELYEDDPWDERFYGFSFPDGTESNIETYTTPNGLEASLVAINSSKGHRDTYWAAFSLNGTPFLVKAHTRSGLENARAALIQILDGFILSE